jgi:hypothetical protein
LAAFLGLLDGATTAGIELQQGITDQVDQKGKGQDLLVTAPPDARFTKRNKKKPGGQGSEEPALAR